MVHVHGIPLRNNLVCFLLILMLREALARSAFADISAALQNKIVNLSKRLNRTVDTAS